MDCEAVGLERCNVLRPSPVKGQVEIVVAATARRRLPLHVSTSLGICLKRGPAHEVEADGRRLRYPGDSVCVRAPGCVWSSDSGLYGFVSVDISPSDLEEAVFRDPMAFLPARSLPGFRARVHALAAADSALESAEIVAEIIASVVNAGALRGESSIPRKNGHFVVERAREFLQANLNAQPSLEDAAAAAGVGKFTLLRCFKRELGTTPHAYLVMLRVRWAQDLLAGGASLSETAAMAGFTDQSHMGRWFKRISGTTPATYLRAIELPGAVDA